ncbi:MAG TPA: META domain-containing protein, partial [Actinomycetota bacterium]|nr:META domain-containing protein [Actinomycetota bacterium]
QPSQEDRRCTGRVNQRASDRSTRSARRRTGWLVGGIVFALLLAAVLWEGQPWRSASGSLVDTRWRIDTVRGAPMVSFERTSYLQLLPHLTVVGTDQFVSVASCNALMGTYEITGEQIRFSHISSTAMGCPQSIEVLNALSDTRSWRRAGNRLRLYDANGAVTLELTWSNSLGSDSNPVAPKPTGTGSPGAPPSRAAAPTT